MTEREFHMIRGERLDGDDTYVIYGLDEGADFRKPESYHEIEATWLKVEGVGFAASTFEFSQYGKRIVVSQNTDGGSAHITFRDK